MFLESGSTRTPRRAIVLSQEAYGRSIIARYNLENCKLVSSPFATGTVLTRHNGPKEKFEYRQAIGSLMYLMQATRPDLAFAVGVLARFSENPGPEHVRALKRIIRYLKGTLKMGIKYEPSS